MAKYFADRARLGLVLVFHFHLHKVLIICEHFQHLRTGCLSFNFYAHPRKVDHTHFFSCLVSIQWLTHPTSYITKSLLCQKRDGDFCFENFTQTGIVFRASNISKDKLSAFLLFSMSLYERESTHSTIPYRY